MSASSRFVPSVARARIAQLDLEIKMQHLPSELKLLERNTLQQALADYKYPVLTLPSEVTSEIFVHFLPSYPERTSFIGPSSPSFLLQVCREWRDVALATPELWSTFRVRMGYNDTAAVYARRQSLLVEWLERSKDCPLSVDLECWSESLPIAAALLDALVRHSKRWQDIKLNLPYEHLRRITGSFPILRDLELDVEMMMSDDVSPPRNFALHTPNLRKVRLRPGEHFDIFKGVYPWSQITVFSGTLCERDAAHVLRSAGALEECSIMIFREHAGTSPVIPPIPPLHQLKSLELKTGDTPTPGALARALAGSLPALQNLDVSESFLGEDPVCMLSLLCPPGYTRRIKVCEAHMEPEVYEEAFPIVAELLVEPWVAESFGGCPCCWADFSEYF